MAQHQPGALERFDLLVEQSTAKIPLKLLTPPKDTKCLEIAELFSEWSVRVEDMHKDLIRPLHRHTQEHQRLVLGKFSIHELSLHHTFSHRPEEDGELETVPGEASYYDLKERFEYLSKRAPKNKPLSTDFTWARWHRMLDAFQWECTYCGSTDGLEQDHIKPIYQGGQDTLSNIVPACQGCNASKGGKSLLGWLGSRGEAFQKRALLRMEEGRARFEKK